MPDETSTSTQPFVELGQVMGELVHDLANEVQVLHGWASLARGEAAAGRTAPAELDRVVALSGNLGRMLRDVLETVAGQGLSPEVVFDPHALTESVLNDRFREMGPIEVRLVSRIPPGMQVRGRASFWRRAVGNLLGNASRHARREIRVGLEPEMDPDGRAWVVARVDDDGPGIAPEDRRAMFQPLWRGSRGNIGLGLSAVTWLVAQLGGTVRYVETGGLGGAAFEMKVPAAAPLVNPVDRRRNPEPEAALLAGTRLLVIDDDPGVRSALCRLLRRLGAEVRELDPRSEPEEQVLQSIVRAVPDFLVLDLYLGERGGIDLWQKLSKEIPRLAARVAFVSGAVPGDPSWDEAVATGQPVLAKPFELRQLVSALEQLRGKA